LHQILDALPKLGEIASKKAALARFGGLGGVFSASGAPPVPTRFAQTQLRDLNANIVSAANRHMSIGLRRRA